MPKRLAVTMAGAVSLGSYEAGVVYEVLDAARQHNSNPVTPANDRIVIDVVTGASAGGMTAVILAHKLLYCGGEFKGPYDNPLYNVWVKRISLAGLQATTDDEPALHSIFSSDLIETISKEELSARYGTTPMPVAERHPAVGDEMRVGLALTNLNGVRYGYPVLPSGNFVYIDYGDQITRHVVASGCDTLDFWDPMRKAAVACGAFPFAFRPQDLQRSAKTESDDYPPENLQPWAQDPATFTYSDGGILQNQPLGIAKNLVDEIDQHMNQETRFYLFVSPHAYDPSANDNFHAANADYLHLLARLIMVVMGQSGFHDWITAKGVNERVAVLDTRAADLKTAIQAGAIDVAALAKTADSILSLFFKAGQHTPPGATKPESLSAAQDRIAKQYYAEMTSLGESSESASAFRDAVLAFETAAGLGARDYMTIFGVTADDSALAGAKLEAFLGFFDQRFRDHDYDVGRAHAQKVLTDPGLSQTNPSHPVSFGPLNYTPTSVNPIDARLNGLKLKDVPAADLQAFKAGLRKRLNQMLREMWGPYFSLPAIPGSDLILDALLNYVFSKS